MPLDLLLDVQEKTGKYISVQEVNNSPLYPLSEGVEEAPVMTQQSTITLKLPRILFHGCALDAFSNLSDVFWSAYLGFRNLVN